MTTQVFRAAIIQTPQRDKDLLSVKADGSEDLYRQSGDPCNVTIGGVMLEKTSAEHDEAALAVYKALKDADTRRCPLHSPSHTITVEEFCQTEQDKEETNSEGYKARVLMAHDQECAFSTLFEDRRQGIIRFLLLLAFAYVLDEPVGGAMKLTMYQESQLKLALLRAGCASYF
ncbi:unnamed protein product [Fusarium venenatum]|uniref:Uncharacterized protein n=1 Tax=Fusarium venenatum TaxID=56646 RepID=A0A2L2TH32_9HYPO|nr:LOW QUALITY PROTEIN: uncharacterized protein FVRRES_01233 [Fusarium venenatum]CEI64721.1 unnamed protein product [Fusarium venenatum]